MLFKSVIRIGFQERRLQYMEKEQIKEWQNQRFGERILEIDLPLSYGILEATNNPIYINECEFIWDSNYDVGVFLKVNCISTEFTPKKHGGEKGVPFRIIIETSAHNAQSGKLHSASCQIKVFKPKGADRKHKTDREKMCKRVQSDKEKYHPQYEYTVFRDLVQTEVWTLTHSNMTSTTSPGRSTPSSPISNSSSCQNSPLGCLNETQKKECYDTPQATSTTEIIEGSENCCETVTSITHDSSASDCCLWLQKNMFSDCVKDFQNFTGKDLLNLTRTDFIDICGAANGIRLFNTLRGKGYLTTYVRLPTQKAYSAIYLKTSKVFELAKKLRDIYGFPTDYNCEIYVSGPGDTRVIVTDEVICNMLQDSLFVIEYTEGSCEEKCSVLLKHIII